MSSIVSAVTGQNSGFTPQHANIVEAATKQQATDQYQNAQAALQQQQQLLAALQGQNGIQNQSSVFNQLQNVAAGQGPNPAQAALSQATGQNVANQAALMAGQRGSNANAGLMARQIANQGANTQQQAAGQAATLQAQQSLNAMNQLGGIAGQQVAQQQGATAGLNQMTQAEQGQVLGAINNQNNANVQMTSNMNNANAQAAHQAAGQAGNLFGNLMGAAGSAFAGPLSGMLGGLGGGGTGAALAGTGGYAAPVATQGFSPMDINGMQTAGLDPNNAVRGFAEGGAVAKSKGPSSKVGQHFCSGGTMMAQGGQVPALVSPGEVYLDPTDVQKVKQGANPIKAGEKIPGKPAVAGAKNSYANDTVPKTLETGGIVLPRSVTQASDKDRKAQEFVAAVLASKRTKAK